MTVKVGWATNTYKKRVSKRYKKIHENIIPMFDQWMTLFLFYIQNIQKNCSTREKCTICISLLFVDSQNTHTHTHLNACKHWKLIR